MASILSAGAIYMKKVQFPGRLSVCTADDGCRAHWRNDFKLDLIIIFDKPAILSWCIGPSQNPGLDFFAQFS